MISNRQEVHNAFAELSHLHIEHYDIGYANILKVDSAPGGLPSIPSPYTGIIYECRIIDFEVARKIAKRARGITSTMNLTINQVLDCLSNNAFFRQVVY